MDYGQRSNKIVTKMKIGELSKRTGVSRDTIRHYEKLGMLSDISRPFEWNNYKNYGEENIKRIQVIKYFQKFSFKLKEIGEVFDQRDANSNQCIDKSEVFRSKLKIIGQEIENLKKTYDEIMEVIKD